MKVKIGRRADVVLQPDQVNDHNQVVDKHILGRERIKFGVASIMYHSEEAAFGPIHTMVIRSLGGGDVALGITTAITSQAGSLLQWGGCYC